MPAGNDASAAAAELADRFARGDARAEDLRAANRARVPRELKQALMLDRDDELSEEVDWAKAAKAVDVKQADVLDVAIRGDKCVVVFEDRRGDSVKAVCDARDVGVDTGNVRRQSRQATSGTRSTGKSSTKRSGGSRKRSSSSKSKS